MGGFIFGSGGGGGGGPDLSLVDIEPQFALFGKKFYDRNGNLLPGTILNWDGTVLSGPSTDGNKLTVNPSTSAQHIAAGKYLGREIEFAAMAQGSASMSHSGGVVTLTKQAGYIAGGSDTLTVPAGSATLSRSGNVVTLTKAAGYIGAGTATSTVPLTTKSVTISSNGSYSYTPSSSYAGFSSVSIDVSVPTSTVSLQTSRSYGTVSSNGSYTITPSSGYDGMKKATFTVDVSGSDPSTGTGTVGTSGSSLTISCSSSYTLYMAGFVISSVPSGVAYVLGGMVRKGSSTGRAVCVTSAGTAAVGNVLSASFSSNKVTISCSDYAFYGSSYTAYVCYA